MTSTHLRTALGDRQPRISQTAWIAPGAVVVGAVSIGEDSSVFYTSVLRGDCHEITIGARTNVQDGVVIHVDDEHPTVKPCPLCGNPMDAHDIERREGRPTQLHCPS